ncbi:sulfurtransferase-like selenium metabolism protein YedF [Sporomusa sphaeroides DSM 2875]|uniref:sulfurtransferase-like selenium metabolism protein YedF n=1 Tax=Sporomusa sphaeroides TaxID=47679 RepID=UPI00202E3A3B|nr:sulfurtransferase-like selenium metabolism protein YedF [Sporomusa sphaeroides]MCM0759705.1 sulfurtransferase-like selenium metabolism protein YedF [Sporomusa sphaeroides DSM 2875]
MRQINAIGDACPLPVIKTKKGLDAIESGQLVVLVDNEIAVQNIRRLAEATGCQFDVVQQEGIFHITLIKAAAQPDGSVARSAAVAGKTVVVLSADTMGTGDDELGHILMKGFIFALTQLDTLPDTILIYNTGAKLAVQGSSSLEDLLALEKAGAAVLTCGTCLNHLGIAQQLGVGEVTNMYRLVEEMRDAGRILRP